MPIDTLANVKQAIGVTVMFDDTMLTQIQGVADSFIETFCGRTFAGGTFTEYHSGGAKVLFLVNYPITGVTEVRVDASREFDPITVIPANRYALHPARGVVECLDGPFVPSLPDWDVPANAFPNAVRVEYTTVTGQVPATVGRAYAELIGHWYRQARTAAAAGQLNVIEQSGTMYPWSQSFTLSHPGRGEGVAPPVPRSDSVNACRSLHPFRRTDLNLLSVRILFITQPVVG